MSLCLTLSLCLSLPLSLSLSLCLYLSVCLSLFLIPLLILSHSFFSVYQLTSLSTHGIEYRFNLNNGLKVSSGFMIDKSGNNCKSTKVQQLSATPLNSISQDQTGQRPRIDTYMARGRVMNTLLLLLLQVTSFFISVM